jgi:hypothetical protein
MRSSHQLCLEGIEQTLQHAAGFQLHAARHKVLVVRDALADDKECCDALLLKIDHLLSEAFIAPASRSTLSTKLQQENPSEALSAA